MKRQENCTKPIQIFVKRDLFSDSDFADYIEQGNKSGVDVDFYRFIKTLEHNIEFNEWIRKLRKEANIPEDGYDCLQNPLLIGVKDIKDIDKKYYYTLKKQDFAYLLKMLPFQYKFTMEAIDWTTLVVSHAIRLPFEDQVNLVILPSKSILEKKVNYSFEVTFKRNFTKEELHKLIDDNWYWMNRLIPRKQKVEAKDFRLSERDIFLLQARNFQKLKFDQIADQLSELYPKDRVFYAEDTTKKAYHRANSKVKLSFSKKNEIHIDSEIFSRISKAFVK